MYVPIWSKYADEVFEVGSAFMKNGDELAGAALKNVDDAGASLAKSADEAFNGVDNFLPDEFYNKNLPSQVTPGTKYLPKYDEAGNVKQIKMYDEYGRETAWVDYTNHGYGNVSTPDYHTVPHWHEKVYNEQYTMGKKINHRTDTNTPLGGK